MKRQKTENQQPNYIKRIRKEINYLKPHENDDLEWYEEGLSLLDAGRLIEAEQKFKELIVSQPDAQDGYEGLALVYERLGRKDEALYFIREAFNRAKKFIKKQFLEERYGETLRRIEKME
jgi:tetratricopeptide (TPR) repeat protein